ncbi:MULTISPECIES: diacylglycerol/lipid kinase family protein [Clostridia]|uniref:Diacylglycerol kinase n=1 Tax=Lacrimispora celerecrescens TaxID=29354 RepID=A0A084JMQ5_9FIRM|nr:MULTISPECIES: YegS/Rv2252/BmrU family lipid kinase [Clostridia]KEZ90239.1 diacylglycerol kinase [Lacrimispora celerecrescens]MBW4845847.1 YegS/Rv2252/BmrU family lipid kinase [Lachnospiraceae bacterium]MSS07861.1 YegS/Rv2252/BmrU family lipid kinase [Clostridium sp. WB02_MRS01]
MKKILFIFNPRSGKAQIRNKLMDILDIFAKAGYELSVHVTQRTGDAMEAAAAYGDRVDLVVCSGGDGTLNETISGLMKLDHIPDLGYIPAGSTNDFASSLKISKSMVKAAEAAVFGEPYSIDIGCFCGDRYFVYIAAFGAFTEVSYLTPQDKKNVLGHQAYMLEGMKSLASIKSYEMRIECDELTLEGEFIFGMITNTMSVGGFKGLVTQDVALDDGEFEVLLIRTPKTPLDLTNIINYMFLKEEPNEYVHKFRTRSLRILSEEPIDWVLDGEFGGTRREVNIINLKKRIRIMRKTPKKQ